MGVASQTINVEWDRNGGIAKNISCVRKSKDCMLA